MADSKEHPFQQDIITARTAQDWLTGSGNRRPLVAAQIESYKPISCGCGCR